MANVSDLAVGKNSDDLAVREPEQNRLGAGLNEDWSSRIKVGAATVWDDVATRLANLRPNGHYGSTIRYALVAGLIFLGLATRWGLHSFFGGDFPFEFFFVVIAFAAGFAGFGPALAAAVFGYVLADWFVLPPHYNLSSRTVADWGGTFVYLGGGLTVVGLGHILGVRHRKLEREVLEISEREQQRIGQDLHDGLGQHLTGTALIAHMLHQKLAAKSMPEAAEAAKIMRLVRQATAQTRALARGLHPMNLEAGGLVLALQELTILAEECSQVTCRFESSPTITIKDTGKEMHLYRIAQEAVNNSLKHAQASRIDIRLFTRGPQVVLMITDDGIGIRAEVGEQGRGMGLRVMQHRAKMIGGTLSIQRAGERGTMVTCVLLEH
jgi:signal transduction histidine kinase